MRKFIGLSLSLALGLTALIAVPVSAATTSESFPFVQLEEVPCANGGAGETVSIEGTLHVVVRLTTDKAGGVHTTLHFQPQGVKGTGLTTGDIYRGGGVTRWTTNTNSDSLPLTETHINNFRLIGPGPGNNVQVHMNTHVTINANGVITAEVDNSSAICTTP
jgi:hypothetical protein